MSTYHTVYAVPLARLLGGRWHTSYIPLSIAQVETVRWSSCDLYSASTSALSVLWHVLDMQARSSKDPQCRFFARLAVAGLPRGGGDGDAIRHGILNIMRENGIKEGHRPVCLAFDICGCS